MEVQTKKMQSSSQASQIQISIPNASIVDFSSRSINEQLTEVKNEVKAVLDGAHIDSKKLSLSFTV